MNYYGLIIPGTIAVVLIILSYTKGGISDVGNGIKNGGGLFISVLPNLCIGFLVAGFLTILVPAEFVAKHLGRESGMRGILFGTIAGIVTPGGPFTHFPILASFLDKGASIGPVASYVSAWALLGIHRIIIWELPILGFNFAMIRILSSLAFPIIIGIIASAISSFWKVA